MSTESALGMRLRALRNARGWTLDQASQASGLARSTLSKIENGLMSPTYDALLKLAAGFALDVAELFREPEVQMGSGRRSISRRGQGPLHETPYYQHQLLCTELAHKRMMPFVTRIRVHALEQFDEWSRHAGEEFLYVLSGEIEVHSECYQPVRLGVGDSIYFDSRMGHRVRSLSEQDAEVLWVSTQPRTQFSDLPQE